MKIKDAYPEIAILMATYNGGKFLSNQLNSLLVQTYRNWYLYVSDDGSSDQTLDILQKFKNRVGETKFQLRIGPQAGFAKNFISLLKDQKINADYYAFSDQDDIWDKDKLSAAVACLSLINPSIPSLYCGRTVFVSEGNDFLKLSDVPVRCLTFHNALVQNIASGNTMIFNHAARNLIINCSHDIDVFAHDWWIYIIVTACGGQVFYDTTPYVRYRQHSNNLIGMNSNFSSKFKRLMKMLKGDFRKWNDNNIKALKKSSEYLTHENRQCLDLFCSARSYSGPASIIYLIRSRVYRQKFTQNIALYIAGFLGKL